ncbi:MAG: hypothetical protein ACF8R9_01570 [Phycisphaerales bacterium JB054]
MLLLVSGVASAFGAGSGPLLLADGTSVPHVRIAWTEGDGSRVEYSLDVPLTSTADRTVLGRNLEVFVALGGSRLERGAGHPDGAIVRVGLFKTDRDLMFFEDIANGSSVEIELRNVRFNQDVTPDPETLLQRLRYRVDDVEACGLTIDQTEMFNLASDHDDMGGSILPSQTRYSSLVIESATGDGETAQRDGAARSAIWVEDDGSVSMDLVLPYRLLRHKGDPWALEVPGTFFEPFHFDVEFQVLPRDIAELEGVEMPVRPSDPGGAELAGDGAAG